MQFYEIISVYIAVITYSSQAQDVPSSLSEQPQGAVGENHWGNKPINRLTTESEFKIDIKESTNVMQENKVENKNNPESIKGIISKNEQCNNTKNCDLLYLNGPPRNATLEMHDIVINKSGCPLDQINLSSNNNKANDSSNTNIHAKDKTCRVLTRDTDAFYDNELIQKISDNNGQLPESLQIGSVNREPIVIYKDPKAKIEKREIKKSSDYDYNYYDDKNPDESNAIKGGFQGLKQKISKIIKPQEKLNKTTKLTKPKAEASTLPRSRHTTFSTQSFQPLPSNESTTAITLEQKATANQIVENGPQDIDEISESNDVNIFEENTNIKSAPKKKDPFKFGSDEPAKCLPQGGVPKNPGIPPLGRNRDPEYDKLIKGEIPEKVVKAIIDKVKKKPTMSSELGINEVDLKEIKDLFNSIRNKQNECCMKIKGEFKCFLNWLLTTDPSRRKRSALVVQKGYSKINKNKLNADEDKFSSNFRVHVPSPQYIKLYEEVERVKGGDPWNFAPQAIKAPDNLAYF